MTCPMSSRIPPGFEIKKERQNKSAFYTISEKKFFRGPTYNNKKIRDRYRQPDTNAVTKPYFKFPEIKSLRNGFP